MAQSLSPRSTRSSRRSTAALLDSLEPRTLLSAAISYVSLPNLANGGFPLGIGSAVDGQGNLWVVNAAVPQLEKITKNPDSTFTDTAVALPSMAPQTIVYNSVTNSIFVGDSFSGQIFQVDTNGNALSDSLIPSFTDNGEGIQNMTVASDGAIWFTSFGLEDANNAYTVQIGRLGTDGTLTVSTLPTTTAVATGIAAGPNGAIWVATTGEPDAVNPVSSLVQVSWDGTNTSSQAFNIPQPQGGQPQGDQIIPSIAVASDGSVWYSLQSESDRTAAADQIDRAVVVSGQLSNTEFDIPELPGEAGLAPTALQFDSSGTLWFAEQADAGKISGISSLDPATGDFTRSKFNDPNLSPISLSVSSTDVWASLIAADGATPINFQLADLDLTASTGAITATDPVIAATANQPFSGTIAYFGSSDPGDFTYTIDYGNGQNSGPLTLPNDPSGLYTINGSTTYTAAQDGANVSITITSSTGDVATVHGKATVMPATTVTPLIAQGVPLITGQKDVALAANYAGQPTLVVAQFSGASASYTATINWGDGTSASGAGVSIVSLGGNQYVVELPVGQTKTYSTVGSPTISVTITDGTQTVTVTSATSISAVPVVASQNLVLKPLLGPIVLGTVATFTADPLATANWFKATIHWGDGSTSTGLVVRTAAGTFQVIGLHLYKKKGTYSLTTSIVDSVDAETALATATIKITSVL